MPPAMSRARGFPLAEERRVGDDQITVLDGAKLRIAAASRVEAEQAGAGSRVRSAPVR
jgi:hypothetical protein